MLRRAGAFDPAYQASLDAVATAPDHAEALAGLVESAVATGRQTAAAAVLNSLVDGHPDLVAPRVALSKLYAASGSPTDAARVAAEAVEIRPLDPIALEQLASVFADVGDVDRLAPVVEALSRYPDRAGSRYYAAAQHFLRGELAPAQAAVEHALAVDAGFARAQNLLGAIHATRGDTAAARRAFATALDLDPRDPATYQNLALLDLNTGNADAAVGLFTEALSLDPASTAAREGLARAKAAAGKER